LKNKQLIGVNRFIPNKNKDDNINNDNISSSSNDEMKKVHNFDYSLSSSIFGRSSIKLDYSRHQGQLSLWKTMVDEVRVLKVPNSSGETNDEKFDLILIGAGSMLWSGGMYNCQPFCLYQAPSATPTSLS
jgi:hypothetical protein